MYHVLLFYKYGTVRHVPEQVQLHKEVCKALELTGRVLINEQGINGTVGGSKESIELYKKYMNAHQYFANIDFKESTSEIEPFPKMIVKRRKEIITTEAKDQINICNRGRHIDRDTFHNWLINKEDIVILDMRNDYEWEIGRFVNSVRPPMRYFRELKDNMEFYDQFKDKKIVMFCTGGIRCEPASAYFIANGFDPKNLYQLEGGIVKYAEKYANDGFYEGKCFVFDNRMAVPINTSESAVIVGKCLHCEDACDSYINCRNKKCNKLHISCPACKVSFDETCCESCKEVIKDDSQLRPAHAQHAMA